MAITVDQFLSDLTERQLLSGEQVHAFRRELAANAHGRSSGDLPRVSANNGSAPGTQTLPDASRLILCDCLIQDKLQGDVHRLTFAARRLQDDAATIIHVLAPLGVRDIDLDGEESSLFSKNGQPRESGSMALVDVQRQGEIICLCCQELEAESLEDVVSDNGPLPLELATESLLQAARILKRADEAGLHCAWVSAEQWLVDEDGQIQLDGREPDQYHPRERNGETSAASFTGIFRSLGELYLFLSTGRSTPIGTTPPGQESSPDAPLSKSAAIVTHCLLGENGYPVYESWDKLIADLESMTAGGELAISASTTSDNTPTERQTDSAAGETIVDTPRPVRASNVSTNESASGRWGLFALVALAGIVIAAIALLAK